MPHWVILLLIVSSMMEFVRLFHLNPTRELGEDTQIWFAISRFITAAVACWCLLK